jgi:3-oxoacyl-[acyl-carrier-protein] synthase III
MNTIGIVATGSYLPGAKVSAEFFGVDGESLKAPLLRAPTSRHHVVREERAAEMIERAARPMLERLGLVAGSSVDLLITNVLLPDLPLTGCGAEVAQRLGCTPDWIIDLHNGGCASFIYMLKIASSIIAGGGARTALLCNVQNTAGQVYVQPMLRRQRQSAVPGDGCGVAYLASDAGSPVMTVQTRNDPQTAGDMMIELSDGRKYWEPGTSELNISFSSDHAKEIVERGNRLIPELVREVCGRIDAESDDINVLVTNQPNRSYLRNWRRALAIDESRHVDTFDRYGNLLGAAVPVTLDDAVKRDIIRDGDLVMLAGFAHAGDFAAAAAVRWNKSAMALRDSGVG